MVAKERFMVRGGVRSAARTFSDGGEHTVFYRARMPAESAGFRGAIATFPTDEAGAIAADNYMAKFLSTSLCNEDGSEFMTYEDARHIPERLKVELCGLVLTGSAEVGDAGKG